MKRPPAYSIAMFTFAGLALAVTTPEPWVPFGMNLGATVAVIIGAIAWWRA